jgi:hypothetical protein
MRRAQVGDFSDPGETGYANVTTHKSNPAECNPGTCGNGGEQAHAPLSAKPQIKRSAKCNRSSRQSA